MGLHTMHEGTQTSVPDVCSLFCLTSTDGSRSDAPPINRPRRKFAAGEWGQDAVAECDDRVVAERVAPPPHPPIAKHTRRGWAHGGYGAARGQVEYA